MCCVCGIKGLSIYLVRCFVCCFCLCCALAIAQKRGQTPRAARRSRDRGRRPLPAEAAQAAHPRKRGGTATQKERANARQPHAGQGGLFRRGPAPRPKRPRRRAQLSLMMRRVGAVRVAAQLARQAAATGGVLCRAKIRGGITTADFRRTSRPRASDR